MAVVILAAGCLLVWSKQRAQRLVCQDQLQQIGAALLAYAEDHGNQFPNAENWADLLKPYTVGAKNLFRCPSDSQGHFEYVLNCSGGRPPPPLHRDVVLVVEAAPDTPFGGGLTALAVPHRGGRNVLFCDGHVEWVPSERMALLRWRSADAEHRTHERTVGNAPGGH